MVAENRHKENEIFGTLREHLPSKEFNYLLEWAAISRSITGNSVKTCILRAIASKAKRTNQSIEDVLKRIIGSRSIESIIPTPSSS